MRVMLVNPPDELEQMLGVGKEFIQKYEPLGLLYLAAVLREAGHQVIVVDAHAESLGANDILARIDAERPGVVGFSTLTCNGAQVFELGRQVRRRHPGTRVVLGNIHASVFAPQYLQHGCCDAVVHGEGELVLAALVQRWQAGADFRDLPGTSVLDDAGQVVRNDPPGQVNDLAALPFPARDLVNPEMYGLGRISNQPFVPGKSQRATTMVTSRGCPHRCSFCVVHGSRKPRYNSPSRVVDEMQMLEREQGTAYVFIDDPLFLADRARILAICDEYLRRGLTLRWGGPAHVRHVDAELVRRLAAAGCFDLSLGIESGSQRILDSVRKGFRLKQAEEAVHVIKRNSNIRVEGLFILGLPGETRAEILQTIRFACRLPLDMAQFSIFTPYPGSPLFDQMAAEGRIDTGVRPDGSVEPSVWARYSQYICFRDVQPIWVPDGMTADELRALQKRALRSFYLRPSQVWEHVKRLRPGNVLTAARIAWRGFF